MKKYISLVLMLATSLCSATPTVADVEGAMAANNVQLVEQLSKEVLAVHPSSARANYYLAQAYYNEGKIGLAHSHLLSAQVDDPTLKFTNNPALFEKLLKETTPVVAHSKVASNEWLLYWLFGGIFLVCVIAVVLISKRAKKAPQSETYSVPTKVHNYNTKERTYISEPRRTTIEREIKPICRPTSPERYYRESTPSPSPTVVNNYHNSGGFGGNGFVEGMIVGELLSTHHSSPTYYDSTGVVEERRSSSYSDDTSSNIWDSGSSSNSWDSSSSSSSSWDSSSSFDSSSSSSSSDW